MENPGVIEDTLPLGEPVQVYHLSAIPGCALTVIVAGLVILMWGPSVANNIGLGHVFLFAGILGVALSFLQRQRVYVAIYPDALVYVQGRKRDVFRWYDIEAVLEKPVIRGEGVGAGEYYFTIQHIDGFQAKLDNFRNKRFLDTVRHEVLTRQLPRIIEKLESGVTVNFGVLWATKNGLQYHGDFLPWREIDIEFNYNETRLDIMKRERWQKKALWRSAAISSVPNAFMLKVLADHFQKAVSSQKP